MKDKKRVLEVFSRTDRNIAGNFIMNVFRNINKKIIEILKE
ncbi:MAG: hypothetical protein QME48_06160 [bacterium]|nr:hypothetical protein [bacterium]